MSVTICCFVMGTFQYTKDLSRCSFLFIFTYLYLFLVELSIKSPFIFFMSRRSGFYLIILLISFRRLWSRRRSCTLCIGLPFVGRGRTSMGKFVSCCIFILRHPSFFATAWFLVEVLAGEGVEHFWILL